MPRRHRAPSSVYAAPSSHLIPSSQVRSQWCTRMACDPNGFLACAGRSGTARGGSGRPRPSAQPRAAGAAVWVGLRGDGGGLEGLPRSGQSHQSVCASCSPSGGPAAAEAVMAPAGRFRHGRARARARARSEERARSCFSRTAASVGRPQGRAARRASESGWCGRTARSRRRRAMGARSCAGVLARGVLAPGPAHDRAPAAGRPTADRQADKTRIGCPTRTERGPAGTGRCTGRNRPMQTAGRDGPGRPGLGPGLAPTVA
jgi:hypothetical protein